MSAAVVTLRPRTGRPWARGTYAGAGLVVGPELEAPATWLDATTWAAGVGFSLPTRAELLALSTTFPRLFKPEVYWTCETCGDLPADALVVHFGADIATHWGKQYPAHAIAVRRVPM